MLALLIALLCSFLGPLPSFEQSTAPVGAVPASAPAPSITPSEPSPAPEPAAVPLPAHAAAGAVPILMYHVLAVAPPGAAYPDLYVSPADFGAQMDYLASAGYEAVTMQQLYDHWHPPAADADAPAVDASATAAPWPERPVVISFDDGLRIQAQVAQPILASHHWVGVLNLVVDHYRSDPASITVGRVKRLIAAGWEIDSHTVNHPDLTGLSDAQLTEQITKSRTDLQNDLGVPVNFFCYPSGRYDQRTVAAVHAAGYLAATTTHEGIASEADPIDELPRVRVHAGESIEQFAASLG